MNRTKKIVKAAIIFLSLFIIPFCKQTENPYIPTPDIFIRNFTDKVPKNSEIETELREILNADTMFCENSFQNKKVEFTGENDNIFVNDKEQFTSSAYLSIYRQKIKNKPDIFVLKSRCCPLGPCYTSYFFQKQLSGQWKLFDSIPGEVIDYKKKKDHTIIKIEDNILTGLTYIGFWKEKKFEPLLAYRYMNVEIPIAFSQRIKMLEENKQFNILKKPRDYHIDNLAFRINVNAGANIYILSESEKHYFVMLKATPEQINNIVENYKGDREYLIEQIQSLNTTVKKLKDFEKFLDKTFYNFGWIEKF